MKINIKELFKSDLDPNSVSWWSTDKIDKINYNFNQFANGGPSGPDGLHGQDGIDGIKGNQGPIGAIGAQGFQGITGPLKGTQWNYGENDEGDAFNIELNVQAVPDLIKKYRWSQEPWVSCV